MLACWLAGNRVQLQPPHAERMRAIVAVAMPSSESVDTTARQRMPVLENRDLQWRRCDWSLAIPSRAGLVQMAILLTPQGREAAYVVISQEPAFTATCFIPQPSTCNLLRKGEGATAKRQV